MVSKWTMLENLAKYMMSCNKDLRYGQSLFNALCILDPETANRIRGTSDDCFYNDNRIDLFMSSVIDLWYE